MIDQTGAALDLRILRNGKDFGQDAHGFGVCLLDSIFGGGRGSAGGQRKCLAKNLAQPRQQRVSGILWPDSEVDSSRDKGAKQNAPNTPKWLIDFDGWAQPCEHQ